MEKNKLKISHKNNKLTIILNQFNLLKIKMVMYFRISFVVLYKKASVN